MSGLPRPRAIIMTISDSASRGDREDLSGPAAGKILEQLGCDVLQIAILPDEMRTIQESLLGYCQVGVADLVVTTGGTGLGPRDVTPEATAAVIQKEVPGVAELMRQQGIKKTTRAALSRAKVGVRNRTLIINLPGSVKGVKESLASITDILPHALEIISGNSVRCGG